MSILRHCAVHNSSRDLFFARLDRTTSASDRAWATVGAEPSGWFILQETSLASNRYLCDVRHNMRYAEEHVRLLPVLCADHRLRSSELAAVLNDPLPISLLHNNTLPAMLEQLRCVCTSARTQLQPQA